jgi:pseudouridine kinase
MDGTEIASHSFDALCIGGINLDRKLKALHTLHAGSSNPCAAHESAGGVARNVAENLARLGFKVKLIGQVGRDAAAQAVLAPLQAIGVETGACLVADSGSTGSYTALLDAQGQLVLGMADMALTEALLPAHLGAMQGLLDARLCLIDMNLPAASLEWLTHQARTHGKRLVILAVSEPKMSRLPPDLRGVDTLVLNDGEWVALADRPGWGAETLESRFARLRARGLQRLVVTQGQRGVWCMEADQDQGVQVLPEVPPDTHIIDETGAGDALCAGLCASYLRYPADALAGHVERALRLAVLTIQSPDTVSLAVTPELI